MAVGGYTGPGRAIRSGCFPLESGNCQRGPASPGAKVARLSLPLAVALGQRETRPLLHDAHQGAADQVDEYGCEDGMPSACGSAD